ncbi:hypothetical protein [Salarchaeum sp. JOR-1]|uniref:DUF5789 family protein n=1 Tax=Salarchaeum sp. JOR-1 TaxID=2599399 RepID=UPI0011982B8D|nr:hypothetical protein [Salarchaeum sp. JOR-1]QDX41757.1 hypothetical protein FQU85_12885 [Salarchaeum sp. JOR-1]
MADDKSGRDKKARDAERQQDERNIATELERWHETEPPVDESVLDELDAALDAVDFPATGTEVVAAVGDREVVASNATYTVSDLVPDTDAETFPSPRAVRVRVQRPTIAAAMKRIVEASRPIQNLDFDRERRHAYEKTLRALEDIDEDDEDEGIDVVTDWIVERISQKNALPGSRDVRRRAAKFCRSNDYAVRDDEWLGV